MREKWEPRAILSRPYMCYLSTWKQRCKQINRARRPHAGRTIFIRMFFFSSLSGVYLQCLLHDCLCFLHPSLFKAFSCYPLSLKKICKQRYYFKKDVIPHNYSGEHFSLIINIWNNKCKCTLVFVKLGWLKTWWGGPARIARTIV